MNKDSFGDTKQNTENSLESTLQNAAVPEALRPAEPENFLDEPGVDYLEGLEDSDLDFLGASWDEPETVSGEDIPLDQPIDHDASGQAASGTTTVIPPLPEGRNMKAASPTDQEKMSGGPASSLAEASVSDWFFTFMCMNIPIAGWFYLYHLAFRSPKTDRQNFARALLFYKLVFLGLSAVILGIFIWIGLDMLDDVLAYMEML